MPTHAKKQTTLKTRPGQVFPFGVSRHGKWTSFAISAADTEHLQVEIFSLDDNSSLTVIPFDPSAHKTGQTWHLAVKDLPEKFAYGYRLDGSSDLVIDPYGHHLDSPRIWNSDKKWRSVYAQAPFDWQEVPRPKRQLKDQIIYEMHVRGFTIDPSSKVSHPGTYLGVIEKIPYLQSLGITTVELLPVYEFNESEYQRPHPDTGEPLCQYWGYSPLHFFAPMGRYTVGKSPWAPADEFRTMVRELHRAGIEVILDVVYNHSGEKDKKFPSLRSLNEPAYFIKSPDGSDTNYSGCGNTINANDPLATDLILNSLRYWVSEMRVDGFRFDLASALSRAPNGEPLAYAPVIEAIGKDPLLSDTTLIAEAWDAAGLYQLGNFAGGNPRWVEWNGKYRDDIRRFIKGTPDYAGPFATRLCGSQDLYGTGRTPAHSINYVTAHDGFSLSDLVSYNNKHNAANGENNRDGSDDNDSWNCGHEGLRNDPEIIKLRDQQWKNFALALLVSMGVPMVRMGDEYGHTQEGNNNVWCQDNRLSWMCWDRLNADKSFWRFLTTLIALRKNHSQLRREQFLADGDIVWHDKTPNTPDWNIGSRIVAFTLPGDSENPDLYIAFNAHHYPTSITLPFDAKHERWCWLVDTSQPSPDDITDLNQCRIVPSTEITLHPHSAVLLRRSSL